MTEEQRELEETLLNCIREASNSIETSDDMNGITSMAYALIKL